MIPVSVGALRAPPSFLEWHIFEKMESKAHYDLEVLNKNPTGPGLFRKLMFLSLTFGLFGYWYKVKNPVNFQLYLDHLIKILNIFAKYVTEHVVTSNGALKQPVIPKLVHE